MTISAQWVDTVQDRVLQTLAVNTGLPPGRIDPDAVMATLPGMDSIKLLRAVADLEEACGVPIPDEVLFEAQTARELAQLVAETTGERE